MLDTAARRWIAPSLDALARPLVARNVGADAIALAAFVSGLAAIADIAYGHSWLGLAFFALNRVLDSVADAVVRATAPARFNVVAKATLGAVVLTGIPLAFALADPSRAITAAFLICALAVASAARIATPGRGSIHLIESGVVFGAFALACLLPERFSLVAYVLGVLAFLAAGARVAVATTVAQR